MTGKSEDQQAVQLLIDLEDSALSKWDFDNMFACVTPDFVSISRGKEADIEATRRMWLNGKSYSVIAITSEITDFVTDGKLARVSSISHEQTRFTFPNWQWWIKLQINTDEHYRSMWVKTDTGWRCRNSEHIRTHFRGLKRLKKNELEAVS